MRISIAIVLVTIVAGGCAPTPYGAGAPGQPMPVFYSNPLLMPVADHRHAWETVVDVMDDYFKIEREEPVRLIGNTLTVGRLDTFAQVSPTVFEPWRRDAAGQYEVVENTLQSMRRQAIVRLMPGEGGFWVDVAVFKELEDVARPLRATAGAATFRYDESLNRLVEPVGEQEVNRGWIPQGRDTALEQRILGDLQARLGRVPIRSFLTE